MKRLFGILSFLILITTGVKAAEENKLLKIADHTESKVLIENFEKNWNKEGHIKLTDFVLEELKQMGLESEVKQINVYTKKGESFAIIVTTNNNLYSKALSACDGTEDSKCNCRDHGARYYDWNNDGFCDWNTECIASCGPGPGLK